MEFRVYGLGQTATGVEGTSLEDASWVSFFSLMLHGSTKVVVRAVALLSANTRINRMSLSKVVYVSESNN